MLNIGDTPTRPTILVVDGEVLVRHAIADYLRDCGYAVIEAATAEEAQIVLAEATLVIAAMLCDVSLPGEMNGFQLRKWLAANRPDVPAILAGSVASAAKAAAELCDERPDIGRPYDPQLTLDYVKQLLAQKLERLSD